MVFTVCYSFYMYVHNTKNVHVHQRLEKETRFEKFTKEEGFITKMNLGEEEGSNRIYHEKDGFIT